MKESGSLKQVYDLAERKKNISVTLRYMFGKQQFMGYESEKNI